MIKQFNNLSSWRKEEITIEPHELYTLNYRDTMPNIFVIVNPNECNLKVGITNLPRVDSYEFKVDYNSTETVGRPIGTHNLYILNDSSAKAKIIVFSIEKEFDPQILKNMNVSMEGYTLETAAVIQGFADGVSLPADPELLDSIANLKSVHLSNIHNALDGLVKENTFTGKTNSILEKMDTLISGQGSGGGGTGGTVNAGRKITTITWDGDTTGRDSFSDYGINFYKVSDLLPDYYDIHYGIINMSNGDESAILSVFNGINCLATETLIVAYDMRIKTHNDFITIPSTGIYFAKISDSIYQTGLKYTEVYSSEKMILDKLKEIKESQDWANLATKLSSFDTQLSELLTSCISAESNTTELHKNVKKLLNALTVFEDDTVSGSGVATYLNNVTSFSFTAAKKCKIHFGWLFYDGGTTANLKIGSNEVLTIMKDERLTDIELELAAGDVVTLESTEPMYRIKYWIY